LVEQLLMLQKC